jgi:hypothetical protein
MRSVDIRCKEVEEKQKVAEKMPEDGVSLMFLLARE